MCVQVDGCGLDVLVEKPIAVTTDEAREMVSTASNERPDPAGGPPGAFQPSRRGVVEDRHAAVVLRIHRLSVFTPRSLDVDVVSDLMIHDLTSCCR